jgi:predicted Fe-S protein YdhL (DUF1289 family)
MCSTTYGDLVCRGCRRFAHEIVAWNGYGDAEKRAVLRRLRTLRDQVVTGRLEVVDEALLDAQLERRRIPHDPEDTAPTRAYLLLRRGARHMRRLDAYGLRARPGFEALSCVDLRDRIDLDFQALSEAHYERYFAPKVAPASAAS